MSTDTNVRQITGRSRRVKENKTGKNLLRNKQLVLIVKGCIK